MTAVVFLSDLPLAGKSLLPAFFLPVRTGRRSGTTAGVFLSDLPSYRQIIFVLKLNHYGM
jgi:hypothetical protein